MATATRRQLLHPCTECPTLIAVGQSRCARHARPAWGSRTSRPSDANGWAWGRTRKRILERDGHRCRYCGAPATSVDHVVSVARGGTDDDSNLVAACDPCQSAKAATVDKR